MKTKLLIALVAVAALTGCATRTGTAIVAGTTGVIIGHAMSQPRTVIVHEEPMIVSGYCNHYYAHSERVACERGVRQRHYEEQRRRDNAAYRAGYGR
jgi:hypothetical protein